MPGSKEKVGFIFECGRDGPDFKVCDHFLARLNPRVQMIPRFLDHAAGSFSWRAEIVEREGRKILLDTKGDFWCA